MSFVLSQVLLVTSLICTLLATFVFVEVLYGKRGCAPQIPPSDADTRAAIIMPAHNEEIELGDTLINLMGDCPSGTRIVVVADHCDDDTVRIAKSFPVEIIQRTPPSKPGKSHALADGVRHLAANPPDVVVLMDADCRFTPGSLRYLIASTNHHQRTEQAIYCMSRPQTCRLHDKISAFAFQFKNEIRGKGLAAMRAPCHLTGSGMSFPWRQISALPLQSESLVEDLELGITLAARGTPAYLCEGATIFSHLPQHEQAALRQRRRWEHGYLRSIVPGTLRLLRASLRHRNPKLALLALDLCIPPLSFLCFIICFGWSLSLIAAFLHLSPWTLWAQWNLVALILVTAVMTAVVRYPDTGLQLTDLTMVPRYLAWKAPVIFGFFHRPERKWQRTDRSSRHTLP